MPSETARMQILQMIADGKITAAQGLQLLDALPSADTLAPADEPARALPDTYPDMESWRRWWRAPFGVGLAVSLAGAWLLYGAYHTGGPGFWFACAMLPFMTGVLITAAALASRSARWLHVRVHASENTDDWPRDIAISFPLPIRLTAWLLRAFGPFIPQLKEHGLDELILAVAETTSGDKPLYVDVDEGRGGERVQVYLG